MNNGADAADQIVNLSLKGIEVLAKISGEGAKNLATYLYAVLKDQKKTKGKIQNQKLAFKLIIGNHFLFKKCASKAYFKEAIIGLSKR